MKRRHLKKLTYSISALLFFVISGLFLRQITADVIFEPEDGFFKQHTFEMRPLNENRYASGKDGSVTAYVSPSDKGVLKTFDKGEVIFISYTYLDNNDHEWSLTEFESGDGSLKTCWIPSVYLVENEEDVNRDTASLPVIIPDDRAVFKYIFFICAGVCAAAMIFMAVYVNVTMKKRRQKYMQ